MGSPASLEQRLHAHLNEGRFVWFRRVRKTGLYIVLIASRWFGMGQSLKEAFDQAEGAFKSSPEGAA